jgi:uncharacterized membrane protein
MSDEQFSQRLEAEVAQWQRERLITAAQAAAILTRYGLAEGEQRRGRLAVVLAFLGALLVGAGVIVLFAANWQEIPGWTKLVSIFAAVAAANSAGFWLRYQKQGFRGTGDALLFLGSLLFGAAVFLVAQGFHINANEPALLLLWAAGILPMAYLLGSRAMIILVLLNLTLALGWETSFWLDEFADPLPFTAVFLLFGALLYALGRLHGAFEGTKRYELPYASWGLFLILGTLFLLTFDDFQASIGNSVQTLPPGALTRFVALLAGTGAVTLANLLLRRRPSPTRFPEIAVLVVLIVLGGSLFFLGGAVGPAARLFFNLLLLALIVGSIVVGYWDREPAWVNLGILFFAFLTIARYFDWFWALLPRSVFFIVAGLLLLLGGMALERARRRVLGEWHEERGG